MIIKEIIISKKYAKYLQERNLVWQYLKAKNYILSWDFKSVDFKIRQPKNDNVYYFRLNKQFRIFWVFDADTKIFKIKSVDNHQN